MAQASWSKRWIKPEIFPLFAAVGADLGICAFAVARNFAINPDVRSAHQHFCHHLQLVSELRACDLHTISKEDRTAGILENYKEGKMYKDHGLREYLKHCKPDIMPGINGYFSSSK